MEKINSKSEKKSHFPPHPVPISKILSIFVSMLNELFFMIEMRKIGFLILCVAMTTQVFGQSGTMGTLTWEFKDSTFTISGNGAIPDYELGRVKPWNSVRSKIKTVIIKEGVTAIGNRSLVGLENMLSIDIPVSVTRIGDGAFNNCPKIASIIIPEEVTTIGEGAFQFCESLTSINIPEGVTSIADGIFYSCRSLKSITIPSSIKDIGAGAFEECSSLKSISIPNGVISIGNGAFLNCGSLTSIIIPSSVTFIDNWAFVDCCRLNWVSIQWSNPSMVTLGTPNFSCGRDTLYVPSGTKALYEAADVWKEFRNIIEGVPQSNETINNYKVWSSDGNLYISVSDATTISIYTLSGALVKRQTVTAGNTTIPLPRGLYLVKYDNKTTKILVM
ncbi:MAG: leucine-rich repeat domain-containing protein [Tannerella sp.]|jgi:hypothetical protein|nr:leucine-rich repeat domain-containing protein [Tannerella sp.]